MNIKNLCIAHRGLHDENIPENSMKAFKKAVSKNIPIEFDIHILKDKNIIVFHDDNLYRMTGIDKNIIDCTYNEIKNYNLKNTDEKIPLLSDVLKMVNGKVLLDIELKYDHKLYELEDELIKILANYDGDVILKSFKYKTVKYLKKKTAYQVGFLYADLDNPKKKISKFKKIIIRQINFNKILKPDFLAVSKNAIFDKPIKRFNGPILVWTIKGKNEKDKFLMLADSVIYEEKEN